MKKGVLIILGLACLGYLGVATSTNAAAKSTAATKNKVVAAARPIATGTVMTITNKKATVKIGNGTIYTANIAKAKFSKKLATSTKSIKYSDVKVGDVVLLYGNRSGKNITATSLVVDYIPKKVVKKIEVVKKNVSGTATSTKGQIGNRGEMPKFMSTSTLPKMIGTSTPPKRGSTTPDRMGGPNMNNNMTMGTLTAIGDSLLTIESKGLQNSENITYSITLTDNTKYLKDRVESSKSALTSGQIIMVAGTVDKTNNTIIADRIEIVTQEPGR